MLTECLQQGPLGLRQPNRTPDRAPDLLLVVDHEDTWPAHTAETTPLTGSEKANVALPPGVFLIQISPHEREEAPRDREPETHPPAGMSVVETVEGVEKLLSDLRRHPGTGIDHPHRVKNECPCQYSTTLSSFRASLLASKGMKGVSLPAGARVAPAYATWRRLYVLPRSVPAVTTVLTPAIQLDTPFPTSRCP